MTVIFSPVFLWNFNKNKPRHMSFLRFGHKCMVTKEAAVRRCSVDRLFWKFSENSQENVDDGGLVYWSCMLKENLFCILQDWVALKKAICIFVTLVW